MIISNFSAKHKLHLLWCFGDLWLSAARSIEWCSRCVEPWGSRCASTGTCCDGISAVPHRMLVRIIALLEGLRVQTSVTPLRICHRDGCQSTAGPSRINTSATPFNGACCGKPNIIKTPPKGVTCVTFIFFFFFAGRTLQAITNTTPTPDNLRRSNCAQIDMYSSCTLCGRSCTLRHVLNSCSVFLHQGRYTVELAARGSAGRSAVEACVLRLWLRIFNRSTVKVSYSCAPNVGTIMKRHNAAVMNCSAAGRTAPGKKCNCRIPDESPLKGECLASDIVYRATVATGSEGTERHYIGSTATTFKARFYNIRPVWPTKRRQTRPNYLSTFGAWSTGKLPLRSAGRFLSAPPAIPTSLAVAMLRIARTEKTTLLNKRSEIASKCQH